jgi:acyl-coenzyme A synthetase/AMP-(fatty) acid ligase
MSVNLVCLCSTLSYLSLLSASSLCQTHVKTHLRIFSLTHNTRSIGWAKMAYSSLFAPWMAGSTIVAYSTEGRFTPQALLKTLQELSVTSLCTPPTAWRMIVREKISEYDLSSLKQVLSAGEPLNPEIIELWKKETRLTIREG